jgi:hypothetical protein
LLCHAHWIEAFDPVDSSGIAAGSDIIARMLAKVLSAAIVGLDAELVFVIKGPRFTNGLKSCLKGV